MSEGAHLKTSSSFQVLLTTTAFLPCGAHTRGSVGPKTAIDGIPTAAARWLTPESLPMYIPHNESRAASLTGDSPLTMGTPASRIAPENSSIYSSAGPMDRRA